MLKIYKKTLTISALVLAGVLNSYSCTSYFVDIYNKSDSKILNVVGGRTEDGHDSTFAYDFPFAYSLKSDRFTSGVNTYSEINGDKKGAYQHPVN